MQYHIVKGTGMGGFMNPPGHAEHTHHVQEGIGRNAGSLSLSYCLTCSYVPEAIKKEASKLMAEFPGEYTDEWERDCYAYWKHCYSSDGIERNVGKLEIKSSGDPEKHAAFLHIRTYFPDAKPRLDLIANPPIWGKVKATS